MSQWVSRSICISTPELSRISAIFRIWFWPPEFSLLRGNGNAGGACAPSQEPDARLPLSVLIATVLVVGLFVLGTLAVGAAVPRKGMDINQGLLVAYRDLWTAFGAPWLGNVMAAMLAFGVLGQVSVIVAGPSTGLLAVGKAGYLPRFLQRTNSNGIPVSILLLQGILVTILCIAFTVLPSVQSAYQLLSQMATIIYLLMYLIMYVAAIRLRYSQPGTIRPFRVPGGNLGMWLVGIVGLAGALIAISSASSRQIRSAQEVR